jgi:hypothetical protein
MLTEIEEFILGGNVAHSLISLEKNGNEWKIEVESCSSIHERKSFLFTKVSEEYEQILLERDQELEFPLPIIGFESFAKENQKWRFLLNAGDVEWAFTSRWPN